MNEVRMWSGGCHCGAVRFEVRTAVNEICECNCSLCTKNGYLHLIVKDHEVTFLSGRDQLSEYTFNTHVAKHWFCRRCGIHAIYRPRSHPDGYSVNARCLEGDVFRTLPIRPFDGRNWEQSMDFFHNRGTTSDGSSVASSVNLESQGNPETRDPSPA